MLKFKEFITERRRTQRSRISRGYRGKSPSLRDFSSEAAYHWDLNFLTFDDLDIKVPMSAKFLKKLNIKPIEKEVFHVTYDEGARQLVEIAKESKKRTPGQDKVGVSTFSWAKGVPEQYKNDEDKWENLPPIMAGPEDSEDPSNYLFKLKARITGGWNEDVYSEPGDMKRRWVPVDRIIMGSLKRRGGIDDKQYRLVNNKIKKGRFDYAKRLIKSNPPTKKDLEESGLNAEVLAVLMKVYKGPDIRKAEQRLKVGIDPRHSRTTLRSLWEELPKLYASNKQVIGKAVAANMNILAKALKGNIPSIFDSSTPVGGQRGGEAYNELIADEFDIMEVWVFLNPKSDKDGYDPYTGKYLSDEEEQEVLKNKVDYIKSLGVKKVSILDPDNLPFPVK